MQIMSGRGDNNKHGTSGRGSSNQSNQPFVADDAKQKKSNHAKEKTGGKPSRPQEKTQDQSSARNMSIDNAKE
jgi:hypothetical protein